MAIIVPLQLEYHQHINVLPEGDAVMYTTAKLIKTEVNETITRDAYADFFYELQRGVLLSLKDEGILNEMQYRHAEETLTEQRREICRARIEGGSAT